MCKHQQEIGNTTNSTVVQAVDSIVIINNNGLKTPLTLLSPEYLERRIERADHSQEMKLLSPFSAMVPFSGQQRLDLLNNLELWCNSEKMVSAQCIYGRGGTGKTRLAAELVKRLAAQKWLAGFVEIAEAEDFRVSPESRSLLIVIDYPALIQNAGKFRNLCDRLETAKIHARILLLERTGSESGQWLDRLASFKGCSDPGFAGYLETDIEIPPLSTEDRREILIAAAQKQFGHSLHSGAKLDQLLANDDWADPLMLLMAVCGTDPDAAGALDEILKISPGEYIEKLAQHELGRFGRNDSEEPEPLLMAVCSALAQGLEAGCLDKVAQLVKKHLESGQRSGEIVRRFKDFFPVENDRCGYVRPDVLGEAFIYSGLEKLALAENLPEIFLKELDSLTASNIFQPITRMVQDFHPEHGRLPKLGRWALELISRIAELKIENVDTFKTMLNVTASLPDQSLTLAPVSVRLYSSLVAYIDIQEKPDLELRALCLNNLGNRLSDLGRREEALTAANEAVTIQRKLAKANPAAFLQDLASSLNNLGNRLSGLGLREEALTSANEAVTIQRKLAKANPDAFLPDLAMSLNNLGSCLSDLGRREKALAVANESVTIQRKLAKANPDAFLPDLAMSLNNLGGCLSDLGRRDEALATANEAVTCYRKLAQTNPAAFLPNLAGSLNNLGNRLSDLGRREEALAAADEALIIWRQLAQANPAAFLPDLAMSLNNLGSCLSDLGRREKALAAANESVAIRHQLATANPAAFMPVLARSISAMRDIYFADGDYAMALALDKEAIEILSPFFMQTPAAFAELMATVCRDYMKSCEALETEPDAKLLAPIDDVFNQLKEE